MHECISAIQLLVNTLDALKNKEMKEIVGKIDIIEKQYDEALKAFSHNHPNSIKLSKHEHKHLEGNTTAVDNDVYRRLNRVSIPVFKAKKKNYEF